MNRQDARSARGAKRVSVWPLSLGVPCVLAVVSVSSDARAHRPTRPDAWWSGLDPASTSAPADGVQIVRIAPEGRVRLAGGTFIMGSSMAQMVGAIDLCSHEVLRAQCPCRDRERPPECRVDSTLAELLHAEGEAHPVTLSPFEMDRTEVTVAAYARCVSAGPCAPPDTNPDDRRFGRPELPVTHVRWDDARDYCRWAGGRLPTEAEWEYAARGPEGRAFPWGNAYNAHLANHGSSLFTGFDLPSAQDDTDATDGFTELAPVGSLRDGATPLGVLDMAGNVAEWVSDEIELDANGRPVGYAPDAQTDPQPRAGSGGFHVVRGGSYRSAAMWMRAAARDITTPLQRPAWVGFRCVADLHR
jgi:sulfatase modifying factor 1